jgi:hypothetical protein
MRTYLIIKAVALVAIAIATAYATSKFCHRVAPVAPAAPCSCSGGSK